MASLCFTGTESSELSGEIQQKLRELDRQRRLRGETRYFTFIDMAGFFKKSPRKQVVIGDWHE
jgi:hypothetical protein